MSGIEISSVKFRQPLVCKCGRALTSGDVRALDESCEIVCSACHASVLEIELHLPMGNEPWD